MIDIGWNYRFKRALAQAQSSLVVILAIASVLGCIAGFTAYNWREGIENEREILTLKERVYITERALLEVAKEYRIMAQIAEMSAGAASVAMHAAVLTQSDVGQLAELTRAGWKRASRKYKVEIPDYEPECIHFE